MKCFSAESALTAREFFVKSTGLKSFPVKVVGDAAVDLDEVKVGCVGDIDETSQNRFPIGASRQRLVSELEEVRSDHHGMTDGNLKVSFQIPRSPARVRRKPFAASERSLLRVGVDAPFTAEDWDVKVSVLVHPLVWRVVVDVVGNDIAVFPSELNQRGVNVTVEATAKIQVFGSDALDNSADC